MKALLSILLLMAVGCNTAPPPQANPPALRDRRPEVPSRTMTGSTDPSDHPTSMNRADLAKPTTSPTGDVFPGGSVDPLTSPVPRTDPARFAPAPDRSWDQPSPTDPASDFDRRFDRRNQYDDLNRMDPLLRDPPASIWERDFDPQRK